MNNKNNPKKTTENDQAKQQQDERGEINLGGREFTGDMSDQQTSSTGVPTMDTNSPAIDERDNKNSETAEKS